MRRGKRDGNHAEIVNALRDAHAWPVDLAGCGGGVPDLAVLYRGQTTWLEVKTGRSAKNRKDSTAKRQQEFREIGQAHGVHVYVVTSPDEALSVIGATK